MFSHFKRRLGVITAITVMAALVPVLSNSASAAPLTIAADPGDSHTMFACPTGSASAAGFTDTTSTDVDCIAMYGITKGVTETTYEPSSSIPRWQMALYLTRTASLVGHTLGSGADQGFTDISGKSAEIQTAVNQLKQLAITTGTTATTFSPDDNVTREQMAMFVNRLLRKTLPGPGGNSDDATVALGSYIVGNAGDAYNYTDIDGGSVTWEGHSSIVALYNLGVPGDLKAATTFSPAGEINRGEMATWLTNALDHTNARPAGLTAQLVGTPGNWGNVSPAMHVSYRDANHAPVSGQVVDSFYYQGSVTPGVANWSADGTCNLNAAVAIAGNSLTKCTIDVGDPATNAYGNIAIGTLTSSVGAYGTDFYAFTAAAATKYDNDIHAGLSDSATVSATRLNMPVNLVISCDINSKAGSADSGGGPVQATSVHHGTTVTFTAQLTAARSGNVDSPVAFPLKRLTVAHTTYAPGSDTAVATATTSAIYTDATGAATYSVTGTDPNLAGTIAATDDVIHTVLITDYGSAPTVAEFVPAAVTAGKPCHSTDVDAVPFGIDFQDTVTDAALTATQTQNVTNYKAAASALTPISRTSTVTVTDKFGDAITGGNVVFGGADIVGAQTVAATQATGAHKLTMSGGADISGKLANDTKICFSNVAGGATITTKLLEGTEYAIKAVDAADPTTFTLYLASDATKAIITFTADAAGTPTALTDIVASHPIFGCAARTVSPQGTASVAWNDTATTSGLDSVTATTAHTQAMAADNAQATAALATTTSGNTSTRWVLPAATVGASGSSSSLVWVGDLAGNADKFGFTPLIVDLAANTIIGELLWNNASAAGARTAGNQAYVQYTYDDNDNFYLNSNQGVTTTATTMAGFEGAYVPGIGAYGLEGGRATGGGLVWEIGDLDRVLYNPVPANTSVFQLGGD
jgi:hypothetical protein